MSSRHSRENIGPRQRSVIQSIRMGCYNLVEALGGDPKLKVTQLGIDMDYREAAIGSEALDKLVGQIYPGRTVSVSRMGVYFDLNPNDPKSRFFDREREFKVRVDVAPVDPSSEYERVEKTTPWIVLPDQREGRHRVLALHPFVKPPLCISTSAPLDEIGEFANRRQGERPNLSIEPHFIKFGPEVLEEISEEIAHVADRYKRGLKSGVPVVTLRTDY